MQERPQTIFLDAVGTIFGLKDSVGNIYSTIAQEFDVKANPIKLDEAFRYSFAKSSPLAFSQANPQQIPELEFIWWQKIVKNCFTQAGVVEDFKDWNSFFYHLYHYFSTSAPWIIYPDVEIALKTWRFQKIELGIISNFDSRLDLLLERLGLREYFKSITISSKAGKAKPSKEIFDLALGKHSCQASMAWHIGDSVVEDWQGATDAGMKAFLIER
jgi:putative hydrolase of the HAD superfamily